jgi:ubiquitin carboxyl-terminal hydrolase 14
VLLGQWWKLDDDKKAKVTEDDVKKLCGGGDWHTAYVCMYQKL